MLPFNFHHLYYFYVIAKEGVMSEAAKKLHVSQPALSAQLKQLENFLGVELFTREGKNLILTDEGRSALNYAQTIFNAGQELSHLMRDKSNKGFVRIRIGVARYTAKVCTSELISFFYEADPNAYVCVSEGTLDDLIQQLKDHSLDIVFSDVPYHGRPQFQLRNHLVGQIPVVFCGHRSVIKKYKTKNNGLQNMPMILPTCPVNLFDGAHEFFVKHRMKPRIIGEIEDAELVLKLVMKGEAVAPLNRFTASRMNHITQLVILPYETGIVDNIYLITKTRKKPHPLVEKAIEYFKIKTGD